MKKPLQFSTKKNLKNILFLGFLAFLSTIVNAQSVTLSPSGAWVPSMTTTARTALTATSGQLVFDSTTSSFWYYNGTAWKEITSGASSNYWTTSGNDIYSNNTGNVGIGTSSPTSILDIQSSSNTVNAAISLQSALTNSYLKLSAYHSTLTGREAAIELSNYNVSAKKRWLLGLGSGTEYGSNAGSDYFMNRYDDNGTYLGQPLVIKRSNGYVGLNNAGPTTQLDVVGTTRTTNFQMTNGATNGYFLQSDASGNGSWVANTSTSDNLGNHTATQNIKLGSYYLSGAGTDYGLKLDATYGGTLTGSNGSNYLQIGDNTKTFTALRLNNNVKEWTISNYNNKLQFHEENVDIDPFVIDSPTNDYSITIKGSNVGINNSNPTENLHIVGNALIDGGKLKFTNTGESVFIGDFAGANDDLTTNQNVFVGDRAGNQNVSGTLNTFVGSNAGNASTASNNVGIGQAALEINIGGSNTAVGRIALGNNVNGSSNVAIGEESGRYSTGSSNTFIGQNSGKNNTGSNNVFIGNSAGENNTNSNELYIANSNTTTPLIYGDFDSQKITINDYLTTKYFQMTNGASANYILKTDDNGNASWANANTIVSETDPKVGTLTSNYLPKWNSTSLTNGIIYDNGTNIGIGTTSPSALLSIGSTSQFKVNSSGAIAAATGIASSGAITFSGISSGLVKSTSGVLSSATAGTDYQAPMSAGTGITLSSNTINSVWTQSFNNIYNNNTSYVGIGTASPSKKLHVDGGSAQYVASFDGSNTVGTWLSLKNSSTGADTWNIVSTGSGNGEGAGALIFNNATNGTKFTISSVGNVGIGTGAAVPLYKLEVVGTTKTTDLQVSGGATFSGALTLATVSKTASYSLSSSDYCIIFTGSTASQTLILPSSPSTGRVVLLINHASVAVSTSPSYTTSSSATSSSISAGSSVQLLYDGTAWRKIN